MPPVQEIEGHFLLQFQDKDEQYGLSLPESGFSISVNQYGCIPYFYKAEEEYEVNYVHFHGNNKSIAELEMAVDAGIGCVVVDNFYELDQLSRISWEKGKLMKILLRITPGIEAHTHEYISTGQEDSKFGFEGRGYFTDN